VKAQGLEGLVAKRRDGRYEPGERSGAWRKFASTTARTADIHWATSLTRWSSAITREAG
jgi:ATP-dependent DNA ligase